MNTAMLYLETPTVHIPNKYIGDDEAYAEAIEAFPVVCADCLLTNHDRGTVYLAKRKAKPMSGEWWFIGGRIFAGEPELDAMTRCIKRETSLVIDPASLIPWGLKRYFFKDRQQAPQNKGCDSLCYVFELDVSDQDVDTIVQHLDPDEYDLDLGLREFDAAMLTSENVFPSIVDIFQNIFPTQCVERPAREEEIETWLVACERSPSLENAVVLVVDKDLPQRLLLDCVPEKSKDELEKLIAIEGGQAANISFWSAVAVLLNKTLSICRRDGRYWDIYHYYYTVFPDGTVIEGGYTLMDGEKRNIEPEKPRRPVLKHDTYSA